MTWEPNYGYEAPLPDIRLKESPASANSIRAILAEQNAHSQVMAEKAEAARKARQQAQVEADKQLKSQQEATRLLQMLTRDLFGTGRRQWNQEQEALFKALQKAYKQFEGKRNG